MSNLLPEAHPDCECTAFLNEEKRREWAGVFPNGSIPLQAPYEVTIPNGPPGTRFWIVNRTKLGAAGVRRMAEKAAAVWNASIDQVLQDYEKTGIAIRTTHTAGMAYCSFHVRLML